MLRNQQAAKGGYGAINSADDQDVEDTTVKPSPEDKAGWLSTWFFYYVSGLIWTGYKRPLEHTDLPNVSERDDVERVSNLFQEKWDEEKKLAKPSLVRALRKTFGARFLLAGIPKLMQDLLGFIPPLVMSRIIGWLEDPSASSYEGYIYAVLLFVAPFLQTVFVNQYFYLTFNTGMQVRAAIVTAVYKKSLRLSPSSRNKKTQGEIVNMQSNDPQRLQDLCPNFHLLWSAPLQIIISLVLLIMTLGTSALVGLGVMIILVPAQGFIASRLGRLRHALLAKTDQRVRIVNEILQGIRVIKYYAWEGRFAETVEDIRTKEVKILTSQATFRAIMVFFLVASPVFVSMATFGVFAGLGNVLTPEIIFPALAYFNLLRFPMTFMPMLVISLVECNIAVKRLWDFLLMEELENCDPPQKIGKVGVKISNGTFCWDLTKQTNPALSDVNMSVNEGQLFMIVGTVGSGKTTLLTSILGSIPKTTGTIEISGTIAYASQQAWIANKTVRENITFNKSYNDERYRRAIHAACLNDDLTMLPGGDNTEIGEKGINLSGGQKQRVALARAVYSDADIIILDDVLSAVDSHVGKHIFEECIMGEIKHKTRIFVTHQHQFLPYADSIVVIRDGKITHQGSYSELVSQGVDFASLTAQKKTTRKVSKDGSTVEAEDSEEAGEGEQEDDDDDDEAAVAKALLDKSKTSEDRLKEFRKLQRQSTLDGVEKRVDTSKLIEAEERESGVVKSNVYWRYMLASGGSTFVIFMFFVYIVTEGTRVANDLWLSVWSSDNTTETLYYPKDPPPFGEDVQAFFLWMYIILGLAYCIIMLARNVLGNWAGVFASKKMHQTAFTHVMHSPVSFFDTTPVGRVLNRFTKDLDNVDNLLPQTIQQFLGTLFICISTLIVIVGVTVWFLVALIPIMMVYYLCMQYYRHTSRELQRLDSISRSPVFSHFSETLSGVDVIRAYGESETFIYENIKRINYNQRAYWAVQVTNRWLSLRLEILGSLITFGSAMFAVLSKEQGINAALVGLSITYAIQVTGFMNFCVRTATMAEAQMNAVERILNYEDLPGEAEWIQPDNRPPPNWPQNPSIVMKNVYMRYRPGLPPVLKNVSLTINPREKIGIVGRTGAGKSSMMLILFRMVEIYEGEVIIDGQNIKQYGLHDLRSRLAIIPQDPVLFSGTVRFNLDPFEEYTDKEIWEALAKVHLRDAVLSQKDDLSSLVAENGSNWSIGQRQLFCFARAILKKTKVLVMDEATSSVDMETDALIQQTIRTEFSDRTVLTIAHRLATVMDSDRVIVMSEGQVVEFAPPQQLINKKNGVFSSMVDDTGAKSARFLRMIADGSIDIFGNIKKSASTTPVSKPSTPAPLAAADEPVVDPFTDEHAVEDDAQ